MAINDTGTRDQYVASAAQTVFAYTFEIFDKDDIAVEQNGILLAEGTNYTVSGVGVDTGGNVTLLVGASSGDILTLYRDMELVRVTDYQQNGDFLASEVNDDFDRLWAATQQIQSTANVGIRPTVDDPVLNSTNTELANIATRGGKALGFAADGTITYLSSAIAGGDFTDVTTTTAMAALASPSVSDVVQTAEFSIGNGGGGVYDAVLTSSVTPNTFSIIIGVADPLISFVLRDGENIDIRQRGATGNGTTDDTAAIQFTLDEFTDTGQPILFPFPAVKYLTSSTINIVKQIIISDNATIACNDNNTLAVDISGGSTFTTIYGHLLVTRDTLWASPAAQQTGGTGVKIRCRIKIEELTSTGHYFDAINFNATSNMNKSIIRQAHGTVSARHGCFFDGVQDDMSVWQVNLRCQNNFASGIFFEDTSSARQFYGHFYTEGNAIDTTSAGFYSGGLDSSQLYVYSEEQTSSNEIFLPAAGSGNLIFSGRNNDDTNLQEASDIINGSKTKYIGSTGVTIDSTFINLNDNIARFWDIKKATSIDNVFQERFYGDGQWTHTVADGGYVTGFSDFNQREDSISLYRAHGTPETPTKVLVSDEWFIDFRGDTASNRTTNTQFAKITCTATTVGGGNKGTATMKLGVANSSASVTDVIEILPNGNLRIIADGNGLTVTSPDGLVTKTIGIDNAGLLILT